MECILDESLGFQVNATANAIKTRFGKFLKPYGIAPEQFATMVMLKENPDISQTEMANLHQKDKTTITRMIDSLSKKEFIIKDKLDGDRRTNSIRLSKKGHEVVEEMDSVVLPILEYQKKLFSEEEIEIFMSVLERLKVFDFEEALKDQK
jgi:DNA-binding MarR family transcriptional regulator